MQRQHIKLSDIAIIIAGRYPAAEELNNGSGVPYYRKASEIDSPQKSGIIYCTNPSHIVRKGDFILSLRDSEQVFSVAKNDCCIGRGLIAVQINSDRVLPEYLRYYFLFIEPQLEKKLQAQTVPLNFNNNIESLTVPLVSLPEQQSIINNLDEIYSLYKKREEINELSAQIIPSSFYEFFGNPLTNEKGWIKKRIGDLFEIPAKELLDVTSEPRRYIDITGIDGKMGIISNVDILQSYRINNKAYRKVKQNDVLISKVKPERKLSAIIPPKLAETATNTHLCVLRSKSNIGFGYLYALSKLDYFAKSMILRLRGTFNRIVRDADILNIPVYFSGDTELLKKFDKLCLNVLDSIEKQQAITNEIKKLLNIRFFNSFSVKDRSIHEDLALPKKHTNDQRKDYKFLLNEYYKNLEKKAILLSYIVYRSSSKQYSTGRVKLAKLYYLINRLMENPVSNSFSKNEAGPFDIDIFQALISAEEKEWVVLEPQTGSEKPVSPGKNAAQSEHLAAELLGEKKQEVDQFLEKAKKWQWKTLERWATIDYIITELREQGIPVNPKNVKDAIQNCSQWKHKLDDDAFSDQSIRNTINGLKQYYSFTY